MKRDDTRHQQRNLVVCLSCRSFYLSLSVSLFFGVFLIRVEVVGWSVLARVAPQDQYLPRSRTGPLGEMLQGSEGKERRKECLKLHNVRHEDDAYR